MKRKIIITAIIVLCIAILAIVAIFLVQSMDSNRVVTLLGDKMECIVDGRKVAMKDKAYTSYGHSYIPVDDVLPAMGYTLTQDADIGAVVCEKNGTVSYIFPRQGTVRVESEQQVFESKPLWLSGRLYIPDNMFTAITGRQVTVEGQLTVLKNGISVMQSKRTDNYRLAGEDVVSGSGVTVVDGFGMEFPVISEGHAKNYAQVINSVAESLDSNINVYSMVVPTAAEFYAPDAMYPNQLAGIQTIYSNLSNRVTPVNVYDTLAENAGENIYFKTDHHWTQRGAYYAYKEFMTYKYMEVPDINSFHNVPLDSFVGSFASFAKGTPAGKIMSNSPETLDRFIPVYATIGKVYYEPSLESSTATIRAVNTELTSYSAFISGDNPITVFDTNAESDKTLVIVKESYGNAFATWAMNDFKRVCVIDPRRFNGFDGNETELNLSELCRRVEATDVLFINYPIVISSDPVKQAMLKMK